MYHFIINPKSSSGKGIRHWWTVKRDLDQKKIPYAAYFTDYAGHAIALASEICSKHPGIKNIVVLGGDGTINEVINGITDFDNVFLGYIPSGSSNDLARSLSIPKDPLKALANVLKPNHFKFLDYGEMKFEDSTMDTRRFCCSSGIGFDANVCVEVQASPLKKKLNRFGAGKLIYLAIAIKQILTIKLMDVTIFVDHHRKETYQNVLLISGMIHKYEGGGLLMAPSADPCDGQLTLTLVHGLSRLKIFIMLPTILFGKHVKIKGVETIPCKNIEIMIPQAVAAHTDGEVPAFSSHVKLSCIQGKIRMIL